MDIALLTNLILVLAGILILLFGGDFLVRGAVALARKLGIAPLIVGLTIVAFGTSAPEMVVSAFAAIEGAPGIAIGNIVGSNIANILLVLGLPAILAPMATAAPGVRTNVLIAFGASLLFIGLTWDRVLDLSDGAILFALIIVYIAWLALVARKAKDDPIIAELTDIDGMDGLPKGPLAIAGMVLIGVVFLPIGAHLIVAGGGELARGLGVSEAIVGLTLIAFGTSLPELATAMVAALRRHAEMAIGNVIGSNIFNLFAVGGIAGVATSFGPAGLAQVDEAFFRLDYWVMMGAIAAAMLFVLTRRPIGRLAGLVLFTAYCGYIGALVWQSLN
ncbi:MAG: calcium/sodium antiporter [Pseudomonadota bacterium]